MASADRTISIKQLMQRYSLGRTALYARLNALGIRPSRQGRQSVIQPADLERMDSLQSHLETGGSLREFQVKQATHHEPFPDIRQEVDRYARLLRSLEQELPDVPIAALVAVARAMICQQAEARRSGLDVVWPPADWTASPIAQPSAPTSLPGTTAAGPGKRQQRNRTASTAAPATAEKVVALNQRERRRNGRTPEPVPSGQLGLFG